MSTARKGTLPALAFSCLLAAAVPAQSLEHSVPPGVNFETAAFRCWVPDGLERVRAVVVLLPGSNGDGRGMADDSAWQAYAGEHSLALIGCHFTDRRHGQMFLEHYVEVSRGSGQALVDALEHFATAAEHPELASAPLLLWGMSAGGQFSYEFVAWRPERVLAFVVNKGGVYYSALLSAAARRVPGILFTGSEDLPYRNWVIEGLFAVNRRAGALWALAEEPGVGHAVAGSLPTAREFFATVLALRLPEGTPEPEELDPERGFLVDLETLEIQPAADAPRRRPPDGWLPTREVAETWQRLVRGELR